jgi:hypothetical protein
MVTTNRDRPEQNLTTDDHGRPRTTTDAHGHFPTQTTDTHGPPRTPTDHHGHPRTTTDTHGPPRTPTDHHGHARTITGTAQHEPRTPTDTHGPSRALLNTKHGHPRTRTTITGTAQHEPRTRTNTRGRPQTNANRRRTQTTMRARRVERNRLRVHLWTTYWHPAHCHRAVIGHGSRVNVGRDPRYLRTCQAKHVAESAIRLPQFLQNPAILIWRAACARHRHE